MADFTRNPNGGGGRAPGLSPNASFRRRCSANPEYESASSRINYPVSPQQSRRQSTVQGITFRTRSPSDPQNYVEDPPHLSRRYSQPNYQGTGTYTENPSPSLVRQERKTYSSLNHLPEVRTYLKFMEDSTALPQRSKSFNGRNSSRRSSYNRRRPRSRPRTPTLGGEEGESAGLHRVGSGSSSHSHYGVYLTPRAASLEQSSPNHLDYDQGNDADVEDIDGEPKKPQVQSSQYNQTVVERMSAATASLYNDCFSQRRSSIRTTFI